MRSRGISTWESKNWEMVFFQIVLLNAVVPTFVISVVVCIYIYICIASVALYIYKLVIDIYMLCMYINMFFVGIHWGAESCAS